MKIKTAAGLVEQKAGEALRLHNGERSDIEIECLRSTESVRE
jgi:hypothetical protein